MTISTFFALLVAGTTLSWSGWLLVLNRIDPTNAGAGSIFLFYATLALSLLGTLLVIEYGIRSVRQRSMLAYQRLALSTRHAILFTVLLVGYLLLQQQKLAGWLNMLLLVIVLTMIELFCLSRQRHRTYEGTT
jgi:hypothetical protein